MTVSVAGESLELLPERAIYWKRRNMLILSDLHLGRIESLQKKRRPVPQGDTSETIGRMVSLISTLDLKTIYVLGDLFHHPNSQQIVVQKLADSLPGEGLNQFVLIPGNHDHSSKLTLRRAGGVVREAPVVEEPFVLSHDSIENTSHYNLYGHLHPMVKFDTQTEHLRRPCFRFDPEEGVLPAFTQLANGVTQDPKPGRRLFADAGETVIRCS